MARIDTDRPLEWHGDDRLLLNDKTEYGLRRRVFARKGDLPNIVTHVQLACITAGHKNVDFWWWSADGFGYLWIVWKEKRK